MARWTVFATADKGAPRPALYLHSCSGGKPRTVTAERRDEEHGDPATELLGFIQARGYAFFDDKTLKSLPGDLGASKDRSSEALQVRLQSNGIAEYVACEPPP